MCVSVWPLVHSKNLTTDNRADSIAVSFRHLPAAKSTDIVFILFETVTQTEDTDFIATEAKHAADT